MLTIEQLRAELARVTYKPRWKFRVYEHRWEGVWLSILAELDNAANPGDMTVVNIRTAVPPIPSADYLHAWLIWRLGRIESHELREFYRVDGQKLHDPHAAGANDDEADSQVVAVLFNEDQPIGVQTPAEH